MSPDSIGLPTSIQLWIGMVAVWIGGAIRIACYRELGRLFTYELTIREKHRLVTSGPYSIVRHPSYSKSLDPAFDALLFSSLLCFT